MAALTVLPFILAGGCATGARSSTALQREVDDLRFEVAALKNGQNAGGPTSGELGELRDEVRRLSANIDPYSSDGGNMAQRLEQLNARLDHLEKATGLPAAAAGVSAAGTSARNGSQAASSSSPYGAPAVVSVPKAAQPRGLGLFEEGKALFDKKDYQGAVNSFKRYLAAEPKGAQADAAQFYIAESLYTRKQYEEAILEYQKVIHGFPKSSQVPTSLFRQGVSFQAIGEKDSAKLLYQKVIREYPKSYAASVSMTRLKSL